MDTSEWFSYQLKASGEGLVWAVEQVPVEHQTCAPPERFGEWSVAKHIFHLMYYERELALPHMYHWLGSPLPSFKAYDGEGTWNRDASSQSIQHLLQEFQQTRAAQITLLSKFDEALLSEERPGHWGERDMRWIVTKTFQHTLDHTNTVLTMALFW